MLEKNITQPLLIALFLNSTLLFASDEIDTITVSADRIKSTLDKSPSDIKVFSLKEIEKSSTLKDLLSKESDLKFIQSGPPGSSSSLFLRGSDSSHVLVIIDGITMNDPSNPNRQFDLGRLSLNNVEHIEILKGSQGLLYGSNAIGGVILITTKGATQELSGGAQVEYGENETFLAALNAQKKINQTSLSFGADHLKTKGFSAANSSRNTNADDDGEKRTTLSAALSQQVNNTELSFNYRYVNDIVDLDKGGGAGKDDPNDSQFTEQQYMKAGYAQKWESGLTEFNLSRSLHHRTLNVRKDPVHTSESSVTTRGEVNKVGLNHTLFTNDFLTQNFNLDFEHEEDQLKNDNENLSFFFYNRFEYGPAIINAGARIDSNKHFGEHLTYKVALMHFFTHFNLKMSYSTGFRAPSLNQLYDPTYGNKNLEAETSQSAEAGVEIPFLDKYKYLATFFYTDLKNRLSYDPVTFINLNRGKARILGLENVFDFNWQPEWNSNLSATWLSARDTTSKTKLSRRPNLNVKLSTNYKKDLHTIGLEGDFTGKRPDIDNLGNTVGMPSYLIFHFNYEVEMKQNLSAYLKIRNLLNKEYEEVYGYGTGGRMGTLGLKYKF